MFRCGLSFDAGSSVVQADLRLALQDKNALELLVLCFHLQGTGIIDVYHSMWFIQCWNQMKDFTHARQALHQPSYISALDMFSCISTSVLVLSTAMYHTDL